MNVQERDLLPKKGMLALCSLGALGLITSDEKVIVYYSDGSTGMAWTGIHLTNLFVPIGSPWSSKNPIIVGDANTYQELILERDRQEKRWGTDKGRTLANFLLDIEHYLNLAKNSCYYRDRNKNETLEQIRKITALGICCLEKQELLKG